jgi:DNA-3-methyladenine glycosylase
MEKLAQSFFEAPTVMVARALIGKQFFWKGKRLVITETEAYIGKDDEACHAFRGRTKRTEVMFGKAGCLYVYFIYGMYYCMNIVTEKEGFPAAVLIRSAIDITNNKMVINGPGKLCKYLAIDKTYNHLDVVNNEEIYLLNSNSEYEILVTPRIGISKAREKPWRFIAKL